MIDFARSKYPKEEFPNLSFQVGDASALNFREEVVLAVSFACLHWVKDHLAALHGEAACGPSAGVRERGGPQIY
jgi:ubiquinone/menaquinone biosynthesis C-methylase UbiE